MKSPKELGLPFPSWRAGQTLAIRTILGTDKPHVVIQAPTGAGKSAIAGSLPKLDPEHRHVILTATRGLEDQYVHDLPFLVDVRGAQNYECLAAKDEFRSLFPLRSRNKPVMCDEGPCKADVLCELQKDGCLYYDQVRAAVASTSALTNYSMWLASRRYGKGLGPVHRLIPDEAHSVPNELMETASIEIPLSMLGRPPIEYPWGKTRKRGRPQQPDEKKLEAALVFWRTWAAKEADKLNPKGDADYDRRLRVKRLADRFEALSRIDETWAWDVRGSNLVFQPTVPAQLFPFLANDKDVHQVVWMSATITKGILTLLGIKAKDILFHVMKNRFPVQRRPVYLVEAGRVDFRMTDVGRTYWLSKIDKIIAGRQDRKGIIHSVSYERAIDILRGSRYSSIMLAPRSSRELQQCVQCFRDMKPPAILLSPSVMMGYNFPYKDAEYQILSKLPFPDTRSNIARARVANSKDYGMAQTAQTVVQAAGRVDRAIDDQGETFITDDHARWFLKRASAQGFTTEWFDEAVQRVDRIPDPPKAL